MLVFGSNTPATGVEASRACTGSEPACDGLERFIFKRDGEEVAGKDGCNAGEEERTDPSAA